MASGLPVAASNWDGYRATIEHGVDNGFRALVNTGEDGRQEVPHFHLHVMGGPRPWAKG